MIFSSESLFVLYINPPQLSNFLNSNCPVSPPAGRLFLPHHPLSSARHFEGLCWLMHPDGSCLIVGKGWAFLPVWSRSHKQRLSVFAEAPGQSLRSNFRAGKTQPSHSVASWPLHGQGAPAHSQRTYTHLLLGTPQTQVPLAPSFSLSAAVI